VDSISITEKVDAAWSAYIERKRTEELDWIIAEEGLDPAATRAFMEHAFTDGAVSAAGTAITRILPPASRFSPQGGHAEKKQTVLERLRRYFERYFALAIRWDREN
jgi:type I restriction enzyme R subunit